MSDPAASAPHKPWVLPGGHRIDLVDVFGAEECAGNPLAVVHAAHDFDTSGMLRLTRWLNFSETAFLLPPTQPEADYRVRIFTPQRELPFAGHPTLGSCAAWLAAHPQLASRTEFLQECEAGLIRLRRSGTQLAFAAPPLLRTGPADAAAIAEAVDLLQIAPSAVRAGEWVDNGPGWLAILLDSAEAVLALEPRRSHPRRIDLGVLGFHQNGAAGAIEVRAFLSDHLHAIIEDPVTGSLNAALAQWLTQSGQLQLPYTAIQGTRLGRSGRVFLSGDAQAQVWVGGVSRLLVSGELAPRGH